MDNPQLTAPDSSSQPSDSAPSSSSLPTKKLFIANLPITATKEDISTLFSQYGNILNIRLLTPYNKYDQRYAVIRFSTSEEALRALRESASAKMKRKPLRVSLYKNKFRPEANICVKNLDTSADTGALQDLLGRFGEIVSCKIQSGSTGDSLNHAYVQFSRPESASDAISQLNGVEFQGQKLRVNKFKPKKKHEEDAKINTLYIRGFDESYTKEQLEARFSEFGAIVSSSITSNTHAGDNKYIGFVRYEDTESAQKAIQALNGKTEGEITWYANIHECKRIRRFNLAVQINIKNRNWSRVNIAIYNLPPTFDENHLKELGSQFGEVVSVKISKSKKKEKAEEGEAVNQEAHHIVGFVLYSKPEEAENAIEKFKDMEIEGNKIEVRKWRGISY